MLAVVTGIAFAEGLNGGLVKAFKSVGENIFGEGYFSATLVSNENDGTEEVQLDYNPEVGIPLILNLFKRNEDGSCEAYVRLTIMDEAGELTVRGIINPDLTPANVSVEDIGGAVGAGIIDPNVYPPDPVMC